VLLLGGALAVEGTAVLAREAADALRAHGVPPAMIARAADLLRDPGISVVATARGLCDAVQPHAMHDPTEGGLATALAELAAASSVGVHLEAPARLPFLPETRAVCHALGLDPLGLLASGALLAAVDPNDASSALEALRSCGAGQVIGRVTAAAEGLTMAATEGTLPLPTFARDELARWLEG
jgi:hydrogenase expression/formation protein HypE